MYQISNPVLKDNPYVEIFRNFDEDSKIDERLKEDIKKGLLCKACDEQMKDGRIYKTFFVEWEGNQKDFSRIFQRSSDFWHPFKDTTFYVVNLIVLVENFKQTEPGEYTTFDKGEYNFLKPLNTELDERDLERLNVNRDNNRFLIDLGIGLIQFEYLGTVNNLPIFKRI